MQFKGFFHTDQPTEKPEKLSKKAFLKNVIEQQDGSITAANGPSLYQHTDWLSYFTPISCYFRSNSLHSDHSTIFQIK